MVEVKDLGQPSPWMPTSDPVQLALLGKLAEELCECGSAASRCIIQGIDEAEPVTGKVNRTWLLDELADVTTTSYLAMMALKRTPAETANYLLRVERKVKHLQGWHTLIEEMCENEGEQI